MIRTNANNNDTQHHQRQKKQLNKTRVERAYEFNDEEKNNNKRKIK